MGLKESLKAWERNADIACLIARMNPGENVEHVLDRDNEEITLDGKPLHVLYLLEKGTYKINMGQESATINGSDVPKILIMDTRTRWLYAAGTKDCIEVVSKEAIEKYLNGNYGKATESEAVLNLAAKISGRGPDQKAVDPAYRGFYIPVTIIEVQIIGR